MFTDIVFPNMNEPEFVKIASKLGYDKLYFIYDFEVFNPGIKKKLDIVENNEDINIEIGFILNQKNSRTTIKGSKLLVAKSSDKDRFLIETKKVNMIYGFEELQKRDHMHQRASGLNQTICELAGKNAVAIGIAYGSLINKNAQDGPLLIGRIIQNIMMCQKYKVKLVVGSLTNNPYAMRAPHEIMSFLSLLGMDGRRIMESLSSKL